MNQSVPATPILIIDDDQELNELLVEYLGSEGFSVETAHDPRHGLRRALSGEHAMVVLDVMLPQTSGFDILRTIRSTSDVPVLMLTARGEEIDRIVGLEMGADDYLPKPFNPRELTARLRAIYRREEKNTATRQSAHTLRIISVGDLICNPGTRTVTRDGVDVMLTAAEFSLLHELLLTAGQVVSREFLSEKVLGRKLMMFDRSIDVHISSLRKKLGATVSGVDRIKTIRGIGYLYAADIDPAGEDT